MNLDEAKTIDELMQAQIESADYLGNTSDYNVVLSCVIYFTNAIIKILDSETNIPSKYDLVLVYIINQKQHLKYYKHLKHDYQKILTVYKDRK